MGLKAAIRKAARLVLASSPEQHVTVNVATIAPGGVLAGKKIAITGGGRGLGLAMARRFASEGAKVVVSGRNRETLDAAVAEIGSAAHAVVYDVSDVSSAPAFLDACEAALGGTVDCLVSNAGVSLHEGRYDKVTPEGFDKAFNTNMRGAYFLAQEWLRRKEVEKGHAPAQLLVVTSETGRQAYDIPYGMTKAAMDSFVRAASRRVYCEGIRVNAIAPGVTLTDMTRDYAESSDGNLYRDCASGRVFLPEEVAEVALFLVSDASMCVSGEVIHTNAGNHLPIWWED
ncbi:SDR family NAD(P)-dependent oxidoreductase [Rubneribacter sp.]